MEQVRQHVRQARPVDRRWPPWIPALLASLLLVERLLVNELGSPAMLLRTLAGLGDARTEPVRAVVALMGLLAEALVGYVLTVLVLVKRRGGSFTTRTGFPNPFQEEVVHIGEAAPITSAASVFAACLGFSYAFPKASISRIACSPAQSKREYGAVPPLIAQASNLARLAPRLASHYSDGGRSFRRSHLGV